MPRYVDLIPNSSHAAHAAFEGRGLSVRIDRDTYLVRTSAEATLVYAGRPLMTYLPHGDMRLNAPRYSDPGMAWLRRADCALPDEWRVEFRGHRRPRIQYRNAYRLDVQTLVFFAAGGVGFGRASYPSIGATELDRAVSEVEGFSPLPSRRPITSEGTYETVSDPFSGTYASRAATMYADLVTQLNALETFEMVVPFERCDSRWAETEMRCNSELGHAGYHGSVGQRWT